MENIGFIGVGRMGGRMARRLIQAGHPLTIFDTNDAAARVLVDLGAKRVDSAKAVASACEVVLVSLPTPPIVEAIALGANGVAEGSRVKFFVDTSTSGPTMAKKIAERLAAKNIIAVDAPVSGGLAGAEKGTLAVMASCSPETFERLKPIFEVMGKPFFIGKQPGQGQTMKLLNNLLSASAMVVSAEVLVMGVKAGLDPQLVMDVINAGTGRNSATVDKIPRFVIPRTFNLGFSLALLKKDVGLCIDEAKHLGVPLVVGGAIQQLLEISAATEGDDGDMTEVVKTIERWAGVEVGKA
jgi:3-hydroxyisobutyrate dehydrogenase-like beta-hydroxyacid dehydrogenase